MTYSAFHSFYNSILNEKTYDNFTYYPGLIDLIYYNNLPVIPKVSLKYLENKFLFLKKYDNEIDFIINNHGYRSPEFSQDLDFLIAGDSVTIGDGLRKDKIWHEMLFNNTNYKYASIAFFGESICSQVEKIFAYIKKYNSPKNILFLMPNFERIKIFNNHNFFISERFKNHVSDYYNGIYDFYLKNSQYNKLENSYSNGYINNLMSCDLNNNQEKNKYFKRPLIADDVIPLEMAHMQSAQSINFLDMYCKQSNINLIYATWDFDTEILLNKISNKENFPNFLNIESDHWDRKETDKFHKYRLKDCHSELKEDIYFYHAIDDKLPDQEFPHFGWHRHIHIKNSFANKLNKEYGYDFKI